MRDACDKCGGPLAFHPINGWCTIEECATWGATRKEGTKEAEAASLFRKGALDRDFGGGTEVP